MVQNRAHTFRFVSSSFCIRVHTETPRFFLLFLVKYFTTYWKPYAQKVRFLRSSFRRVVWRKPSSHVNFVGGTRSSCWLVATRSAPKSALFSPKSAGLGAFQLAKPCLSYLKCLRISSNEKQPFVVIFPSLHDRKRKIYCWRGRLYEKTLHYGRWLFALQPDVMY